MAEINEDNNLSDIKKLLVLMLLDKGYSQSQLAVILGIGQASVSRMFPGGVPKPRS
jgi:predicted transcriptional regulator